MRSRAAPEYQVFPTPRQAAEALRGGGARGAGDRSRSCASFAPDVAVADILTLGAGAGGASCEGVPLATLVPHVHPFVGDGLPLYSIGARLPRTRVGRALWRWAQPALRGRARWSTGRDAATTRRAARLGLAPLPYVHGALSRELTMVGTLPQLEYPRALGAVGARGRAAAVGAAGRARSSRRRATGRWCWSRPSTSQDP